MTNPTSTSLTAVAATDDTMSVDLGDAADLTLGGDNDSSENKQSPYSH
ncbi:MULTISPECIES: albusnodin family lasso peptide [Streptomyces]|nr:albusnodin family lasso peptide [Streptomyces sp. EAG2]